MSRIIRALSKAQSDRKETVTEDSLPIEPKQSPLQPEHSTAKGFNFNQLQILFSVIAALFIVSALFLNFHIFFGMKTASGQMTVITRSQAEQKKEASELRSLVMRLEQQTATHAQLDKLNADVTAQLKAFNKTIKDQNKEFSTRLEMHEQTIEQLSGAYAETQKSLKSVKLVNDRLSNEISALKQKINDLAGYQQLE